MQDIDRCRARVLREISQMGSQAVWTTRDLAHRLDAHEPSVRAAVGWLLAGGIIQPAGRECRTTKCGHRYYATKYRWLGAQSITRVPRDREARRLARSTLFNKGAAAIWLSRAWAPTG
jgi:predicted transcriptional regulator